MAADGPPSPRKFPPGAALAPFLALALIGCTVRADPDEIVIDHMASYWGVAQVVADSHCAKYGKIARYVQMGIERAPFIGIRQRTSVFECVDKTTDTGTGPGAAKERP
ncbi:MAG: hypothetical protein ACE5GT_13195 [Rhodospirillales bacterium]